MNIARYQIPLLFFLLCGCFAAPAQSSLSFSSLPQVLAYADSNSYVFKNATQQNILAKYQTLAARLGKWNLQGNANFSATNNDKLATSFIPAEVFGGPAGTFQKVTFGQKYVSNLTIAPQIDILNPYAAAKVKASRANEQVTTIANLLQKKDLYESLAGTYYNVLSYQWQIAVVKRNLENADSLTQLMQHKQQEGIARSQDINNAKANVLTTQDKLQQLEVQLAQQYNSLKILCDIDAATPVTITVNEKEAQFDPSLNATGNLLQQQNEWQHTYQEAELRSNKKWFLPTVALFSSFSWQQNTNKNFFDNSQWLGTRYFGLRMTVPLLPDVNKAATVKYNRINLAITANNWQHAIVQDSINNEQLVLDYQKACKSYQLATQIELLKQDTYRKNLDIYGEGILPAIDVLNAYNDWLNSSLNTVVQLANSAYAKSRITINNTVK